MGNFLNVLCGSERRDGAEWPGVTFGGSGGKESCDREPRGKYRGDKRGSEGWSRCTAGE